MKQHIGQTTTGEFDCAVLLMPTKYRYSDSKRRQRTPIYSHAKINVEKYESRQSLSQYMSKITGCQQPNMRRRW